MSNSTGPAAMRSHRSSKQKSWKTYLGYRVAANLFLASCGRIYFDQIYATTCSIFFMTGERGRPGNRHVFR